MTPSITVLMPAYNTESFIEEAINSVLSQSLTDLELLIIDDGSTDQTVHMIRQFTDPRIRLLQTEHKGIALALNYGLLQASGKYVARFDADDICLPGRLQLQFDFMENNPDHLACGGEAEYISANGEHLFDFRCHSYDDSSIRRVIHHHCPFIHSAVMYRKDFVLKAGGYNKEAHNFEDYLLWIRLSEYGKFCNLDQQLIKVRFNPASATIDEKWRGRKFRSLKKKIIRQGHINHEEGQVLQHIIERQDNTRIKEGAYYALCGKKFLIENHQPQKARTHLSKAITIHPARLDNYAFYVLSYFPHSFIQWLKRRTVTHII